LGFGVGGLGLGPQPPIPNPQSPIPNPHFILLKFKILNYLIKIKKIKK
jgi:hypothetical protein